MASTTKSFAIYIASGIAIVWQASLRIASLIALNIIHIISFPKLNKSSKHHKIHNHGNEEQGYHFG